MKLANSQESHDLTIDLDDVYVDDGHVLLDPFVKTNGILKILKKNRVIRKMLGTINYNYVDIPVVILNNGKLKEFDYSGIMKHLEKRYKGDE